jgi:hypothetical protein
LGDRKYGYYFQAYHLYGYYKEHKNEAA